MEIPTIHVHTQSDKSTVGYVLMMWETMRSLATHPEHLKLTVHCLGPTASDRLKELPNTNVRNVYIPDEKATSGSSAHGSCVEQALSMTDDGDIHVICDSDTVVVVKGWDDYVRTKLLDENVGIIGTAAEDLGGFSSGNATIQLAKNIPTVAWCALSPLHSWRLLRMMPEKRTNISISNEELSKIYNLPVGYYVLRDVGWQIPQYLFDNKITYQAWKQLKASNTARILRGLSDYHEEYHTENGVPFVVHQRGSLRHAYRSDRISTNFYSAADEYLKQLKDMPVPWENWTPNEKNADALTKLVAYKEAYKSNLEARVIANDVPVNVDVPSSTTTTPSFDPTADTSPIEGWLKATLDGTGVWSRYTKPLLKTISVNYVPDSSTRNLRLEGNVNGMCITLPSAPEKSHTLTVRNLTKGPVLLRTSPQSNTATIQAGNCWFVVVDIDGVFHAE